MPTLAVIFGQMHSDITGPLLNYIKKQTRNFHFRTSLARGSYFTGHPFDSGRWPHLFSLDNQLRIGRANGWLDFLLSEQNTYPNSYLSCLRQIRAANISANLGSFLSIYCINLTKAIYFCMLYF